MKLSYGLDIIGSRDTGAVAIIKLNYSGDPMEIAKEVISRYKHVKSVLLEESPRNGELRTRELQLLLGSEDTEVIHVEYGMRLKLDPRKVYFSPREATERQRIASKVLPGERVLVMFAGIGPYAIAVARKQPLVEEVVGVELNRSAYEYFLENIRLNRVEGKVKAVWGDVREVCSSMSGLFDRIVMPLPKGAYRFLDLAISCLKDGGGCIHFYYWGGEDAFRRAEELVRSKSESEGFEVRIEEKRRVSSYSPHVWKIRLDILLRRM